MGRATTWGIYVPSISRPTSQSPQQLSRKLSQPPDTLITASPQVRRAHLSPVLTSDNPNTLGKLIRSRDRPERPYLQNALRILLSRRPRSDQEEQAIDGRSQATTSHRIEHTSEGRFGERAYPGFASIKKVYSERGLLADGRRLTSRKHHLVYEQHERLHGTICL